MASKSEEALTSTMWEPPSMSVRVTRQWHSDIARARVTYSLFLRHAENGCRMARAQFSIREEEKSYAETQRSRSFAED